MSSKEAEELIEIVNELAEEDNGVEEKEVSEAGQRVEQEDWVNMRPWPGKLLRRTSYEVF